MGGIYVGEGSQINGASAWTDGRNPSRSLSLYLMFLNNAPQIRRPIPSHHLSSQRTALYRHTGHSLFCLLLTRATAIHSTRAPPRSLETCQKSYKCTEIKSNLVQNWDELGAVFAFAPLHASLPNTNASCTHPGVIHKPDHELLHGHMAHAKGREISFLVTVLFSQRGRLVCWNLRLGLIDQPQYHIWVPILHVRGCRPVPCRVANRTGDVSSKP